MGDWTIGTLTAAGFKEGTDYVCAQAPTDWGKPGFILNSDSVVFFKQKDPDYHRGPEAARQADPVAGLPDDLQPGQGLDPGAPRRRSVEGLQSLPAEVAEGSAGLDRRPARWCARMAHNMTVLQKYRGAMMEVDHRVREHPDMSPEDAANAMADAVEAQM